MGTDTGGDDIGAVYFIYPGLTMFQNTSDKFMYHVGMGAAVPP
jgi:hypothetical protein